MIYDSLTEEVPPYIAITFLLHNVSIVHPLFLRRLGSDYDCSSVAGGVIVPVLGHLEECVDRKIVNVVHDLECLNDITPHSSIL